MTQKIERNDSVESLPKSIVTINVCIPLAKSHTGTVYFQTNKPILSNNKKLWITLELTMHIFTLALKEASISTWKSNILNYTKEAQPPVVWTVIETVTITEEWTASNSLTKTTMQTIQVSSRVKNILPSENQRNYELINEVKIERHISHSSIHPFTMHILINRNSFITII